MKKFLHKKWLSIPVIVVLVLALTAGAVLAAYTFSGFRVDVEVDEPLQVQYKLSYVVHDTQNPEGRIDTTGWQNMPTGSLEAYFSAGDVQTLYLRVNNRANSPLTLGTVITDVDGVFTWSGFPQSQVIPLSTGFDFGSATVNDAQAAEWASGPIQLSIRGDAAPGLHTLGIAFTRQ